MTSVSVIDAEALVWLTGKCKDPASETAMFDALTAEVKKGQLVFPDSVRKVCRKNATGQQAAMWVEAVSGHITCSSGERRFLDVVFKLCPELANDFAEEDEPQLEVAALALHYRDALGHSVSIVSDDVLPHPERQDLSSAAPTLGFKSQVMRDYLTSIQLDLYLS